MRPVAASRSPMFLPPPEPDDRSPHGHRQPGATSAAATVAVVLLVALPNLLGCTPKKAAPLTSTLTVLTYNTHLFQGAPAEIGRVLKDPTGNPDPIVHDDARRDSLITERVLASGADIVALQEVWAEDRQARFCARPRVAALYPYRWHFPADEAGVVLPVQTIDKALATKAAWLFNKKTHAQIDLLARLGLPLDVAITIPKQSSGLVLLSKYRLRDVRFTAYPSRRPDMNDAESFASKGVITATVEPWEGGPTFRVGITHARTDVGLGDRKQQLDPTHPDSSDQPNVKALARLTAGSPYEGHPAIMMGDLNVPVTPDVGQEYAKMARTFEDVGAEDAYRHVHRTNAPTVDWNANRLFKKFFPRPSDFEKVPKCIDYVFYRGSGGGLTLTPERAEVMTTWKYPVEGQPEMDLSDHYPVMVTFKVTRDPTPVR